MNDYLDQVEAQLVALTESGAHRRLRARAGALGTGGRPPRRRAGALALGLALVVAVAVVAIALGTLRTGSGGRPAAAPGHEGPHPTSRGHHAATHRRARGRAATSPAGASNPASTGAGPSGPVPAGFAPTSFTAINELTWWLLGTAPCSTPPCTSIVRTTDGGVSFAGVPAPRAPLTSASSQAGISALRFADPANGFAYGGAFYVTHDAGSSWEALNLGGRVIDLAIAAGRAYAIVSPVGGGANRLMSSFVGEDDWTAVSAAGPVADGLWARGSDVFVESADQRYALVSHDQGITFARYPSPSPDLGCAFQELSPPVVWAHCPTGMMSEVWRSTDGGATFQLASGGGSIGPGDGLPNSAAFAAASATTAVVGFQQLYRTTDGGEAYSPIATPAGITWWQYLGFTDATHGVALGYLGSQIPSHERLYYTTDGGLSYHPVPVG
jgi:photosystem II stability/assembly factor-like uncharacterized protein